MKYCYNNLKSNAAKRGKELTLTFSEFVQFCTETNYIQGKGKTRTSFSIDRKENEKGYTKDNIRVLPLGENASKGTKKLEYDYRSGYATVINYNQEIYTNVDNYF